MAVKEAAESFFLDGMSKAIANMARQSSPDYPATIYYAFKQSEIAQEGISSTGWATFLQAVLEAGYAVVGTWPVRTEMANRMIASGTNALANSVVLVCRKREDSAETISRSEFIGALKRELPRAMEELQKTNISPADMPQSAIGPGMGIFSRCEAVLEADDSPMTVKTALQLIKPRTRRVSGRYPGRVRCRYPLRHHVVRAERPDRGGLRYREQYCHGARYLGRQREACRNRGKHRRQGQHSQARRDRRGLGPCGRYPPDRMGMLPAPDPRTGNRAASRQRHSFYGRSVLPMRMQPRTSPIACMTSAPTRDRTLARRQPITA